MLWMVVFGVFYIFISQKYQTPYVDLACFLLVSVASLYGGFNMVAIGVLLWLSVKVPAAFSEASFNAWMEESSSASAQRNLPEGAQIEK